MLRGKTIIVTGGAGLLGKEIIRRIMQQGARAILADIDIKAAKEGVRELDSQVPDGMIDSCELDITDKVSVVNLMETVTGKYGKIDALVNNAYPRNEHYGKPFHEVRYEDFCENINLHLGGYFLCSQVYIGYVGANQHGNILNMASVYGVIPPRFELYETTEMTMPVEYAVIKSGLIHLTRYLARYLKGRNIRVNALSPGGILDAQPTAFVDQYRKYCLNKGMLEPADVSGTVAFLLSDESANINGQNIILDDGFTL